MAQETIHGHILTTERGDLELRVPYSKRFVRDLKDAIPGDHRQWDAGSQAWTIAAAWAGMALSLMHDYYPHATKDARTMHRFTQT
jgi:hypothetical protein